MRLFTSRHVFTFGLAIALGAGCASGDDTSPQPEPGNAELGIERFQVVETQELTTIVGFDAAGAEIARLELTHGRFKPTGIYVEELGANERIGRKVDVRVQDRSGGYQIGNLEESVMHMPPIPRQDAKIGVFLADPHVKPILGKWKLGWQTVDYDDETAYSFNTETIYGESTWGPQSFARKLKLKDASGNIGEGAACSTTSECTDVSVPNGRGYGTGWVCNANSRCEKTLAAPVPCGGGNTLLSDGGVWTSSMLGSGQNGYIVGQCCGVGSSPYLDNINASWKQCPTKNDETGGSCGNVDNAESACRGCWQSFSNDWCFANYSGTNLVLTYGQKEAVGGSCSYGYECLSGNCNGAVCDI